MGLKVFKVSEGDNNRIWNCVQKITPWYTFESDDRHIAINSNHVLAVQFMLDYGHMDFEESSRVQQEESTRLKLYYADSADPIAFQVKADDCDLNDENAKNDGAECELQQNFFLLDGEPDESDSFMSFKDINGETVWMNLNELVMLEVPLWAVRVKVEANDVAVSNRPDALPN